MYNILNIFGGRLWRDSKWRGAIFVVFGGSLLGTILTDAPRLIAAIQSLSRSGPFVHDLVLAVVTDCVLLVLVSPFFLKKA